MRSVCFTGHRKIVITENLIRQTEKVLISLIENGFTVFYAGGALGWDMLCEQIVIRLRKNKYPHILLHMVLPYSEAEQTYKWNSRQTQLYQSILKSADSIEYISEKYYNGCMKKRNQRLVDLANHCVCFYDNKKCASGTGQTVRMAKQKGITITNIKELMR